MIYKIKNYLDQSLTNKHINPQAFLNKRSVTIAYIAIDALSSPAHLPTPPETALISASWFPTTAFLQLRPFAISCNLYSYLFIETQCEHCCTICCCDFDISLIAGFLLPPPPAGSGPCNIVYLYHDVPQCITMHSNICCTPPPAGTGHCLFVSNVSKFIKMYYNAFQYVVPRLPVVDHVYLLCS